jgi:hypothetical protein
MVSYARSQSPPKAHTFQEPGVCVQLLDATLEVGDSVLDPLQVRVRVAQLSCCSLRHHVAEAV